MANQEIPREVDVLIVGGGPAGLIAALQLATNGTRCMLIERNDDTTKWPKMDVSNPRTMEIFKRLGIEEGLRTIGVPGHYAFDVNFSTGLSEGGEKIASWKLPSPDEWRELIATNNDGSMPREPYQRCSQAILEAWLKPYIMAQPLITTQFGLKFEELSETEESVLSRLTTKTGQIINVKSKYVIGCDGAGSRVRKSIGVNLIGGPTPGMMHLIHFKSRDLSRLHKQGRFWHIFFTHGAILISQDEVDTWTIHIPVPIGTDVTTIDPVTAIYKSLGTLNNPYPIKIDQVLITNGWRPNICIAERYNSEKGRVFLAGDSAHQNIPTGGYGMNTAVGDSFDIGWKLAAVLAGHGGQHLLQSYEEERRPIALRNIERSGFHMGIHQTYTGWCAESPQTVYESTDAASQLKAKIRKFVLENDGENQDHGIEMGYQYKTSSIIVHEADSSPPPESYRTYHPGTWPGARAPHLFLADGTTSIYDHFGKGQEYTLIDFTNDGKYLEPFRLAAESLRVPLKVVHLPNEDHAHQIWGRDAVLVRPDDHVAWRASIKSIEFDPQHIMLIAVGKERSQVNVDSATEDLANKVQQQGFSATIGIVDQNKVAGLASFQQ